MFPATALVNQKVRKSAFPKTVIRDEQEKCLLAVITMSIPVVFSFVCLVFVC